MGRERSAFHRGPEFVHSNQGRIHERRPTMSLSFFACNSAADHTWKSSRPLCKSLSREKTVLLTRATEERAKTSTFRTHSSQRVPLGVGSCLAEPDIYLLSPAP